jgi:hypothetical protein
MLTSCFSLSIEVIILTMSATSLIRYEATSFTCLMVHPPAKHESGTRDSTIYIDIQVERARTGFGFSVFK